MYCRPWNTGLHSTDRAVASRVRALLNALSVVNDNVINGTLPKDIGAFRYSVICKLRAEGWTVEIGPGPAYRLRVLAPKHSTR